MEICSLSYLAIRSILFLALAFSDVQHERYIDSADPSPTSAHWSSLNWPEFAYVLGPCLSNKVGST